VTDMEGDNYNDTYLFYRVIDEKSVSTLVGLKQQALVTSITRFRLITGSYAGLVVVKGDDVPNLPQLVAAATAESDVNRAVSLFLPKRVVHMPWFPFMAFVRLDVQPGSAEQVIEDVQELSGLVGVAQVAGDYDILLEFDAQGFDELRNLLAAELPAITNVVRAASSLTSASLGQLL